MCVYRMKGRRKDKPNEIIGSSLKKQDGSLQAAIGALIFFVLVFLGFFLLSIWPEYPRR